MSLAWYFGKSYLNFSTCCFESNVFTYMTMAKKYIVGVNAWVYILKEQNVCLKDHMVGNKTQILFICDGSLTARLPPIPRQNDIFLSLKS